MPCNCCDCVNVGKWQIKGSGGGTSDTNVVVGNGTLNNLTEKWTPLWYTSLGPTTYNLVVTCDKKEEIIDTWTSTIVLCSTEAVRYPEHTISLATTLPDPCKSCGLSFGGETIPVNEVGYTFTGSVDGEWSNQLNWEDINEDTPSGTLPGKTGPFDDDIVIKGDVLSCSLTTMPQVNVLTTDGGNIGISLAAVNATISGSSKVLLNGDCATGGVLYVTDPASFIDDSQNEGTVVGDAVFNGYKCAQANSVTGNAKFYGSATNGILPVATSATVGGNAEFYDICYNWGIIDKNATFEASSINYNTVNGNATFSGASTNQGGITLNAAFVDTAENFGIVSGSATFDNSAINNPSVGQGIVELNATFSGNSQNKGTVKGDADFPGPYSQNFGTVNKNATFSGLDCNNYGTIKGNAAFSGGSDNGIYPPGGTGKIEGNATFSAQSSNYSSVLGTAAFTGSAVNTGTVGGLATFADTASNSGPLTGSPTFADQSTNTGTFTATATFNGDSINTGTITGNQVFNDNSQHKGSIIGNATFNGTSSQLGTVSGNVVCNTSGPCTTQP